MPRTAGRLNVASREPQYAGAVILAGLLVVLAALLFVKVYEPYRRGREALREVREIEAKLAEVARENQRLAEQAALLDTERGLELAARREHYIRRGEIPIRPVPPVGAEEEQEEGAAPPGAQSMAECVAQQSAAAVHWLYRRLCRRGAEEQGEQ